MGKLIPLILALVGTGAGVGAGLMLQKEPPEEAEIACAAPDGDVPAQKVAHAEPDTPKNGEYVKLNNQFIVPVMGADRVEALVVLAMSVEVEPGKTELVYSQEPKLRDAFLQVLFDHANVGGFEGSFTDAPRMAVLRRALRDAAYRILGDALVDILITEIARQDS